MLGFIVFILFLYCLYLTNRINKLEHQAHSKTTESEPTSNNTSHSNKTEQLSSSLNRTFSEAKSLAPKRDVFSDLGKWLATDWLLKLGAFLLILGIAWFVSYAFAENWIGPVGRVSLGYIFGATMLLFGSWWNKRNPLQATVFMVVGVTAILLTTYAARVVYDFFTPMTALVLMAAATAMMAFSSVIQKIESRAIISIALAAIVPFLTVAHSPSVIGLLLYCFVITAATIWIVSITGWRRLSAVALMVYAIYSLLTMFRYTSDDIFLLRVIIFSFSILFYAVSLITHIKVKIPSKADYLVSLGNAFLIVLWIQQMDAKDLASMLTTAAALIFFIGAYLLFKSSSKPLVVLEYTAVALALLASAATFELDGPVLSITYSVLVCIGAFLTQAITGKTKHSQMAAILLIPVFFHSLALWNSSSYSVTGTDNTYLITWWVLAIEASALGYYYYSKGKELSDNEIKNGAAIYLIGGLVMVLLSIWHTLEMMILRADTAHATSLVIYTIIGLFLNIYGKVDSHKKTMLTGGAVLALVVIRLLIVEIWNMDLFQRVIVFSLIGVLLMSTAFIRSKKSQ